MPARDCTPSQRTAGPPEEEGSGAFFVSCHAHCEKSHSAASPSSSGRAFLDLLKGASAPWRFFDMGLVSDIGWECGNSCLAQSTALEPRTATRKQDPSESISKF